MWLPGPWWAVSPSTRFAFRILRPPRLLPPSTHSSLSRLHRRHGIEPLLSLYGGKGKAGAHQPAVHDAAALGSSLTVNIGSFSSCNSGLRGAIRRRVLL